MNPYHQMASLYHINDANNKTNLFIYDTETHIEESKILETPELLDYNTCIAQLPDGELFCFGNSQLSGITLKISSDFQVQALPSGQPVSLSSAIYFNRSVYCFGGSNGKKALKLSERFDLDQNCWIKLTPMPRADDGCHLVIFKQIFLISRYRDSNLLLYSIENDSFNTIPYEFAERKRKILINAERLYLIECGNGKIYESGLGDEYTWKQIASSIIEFKFPSQAYCVYNKGGVYIANSSNKRYYKFDLHQKLMIEI
ncbi:unnamed protein product [Blepharisma stoltei]|uniref:Kelch motif family protein n=1 Tax=Blepharisma stoltei TaxID=1481888 RepID=A0AAU9K0B9_9CILI|nr:unnamed protein product [Blepharisma stoltei]